MHAPFPFHTRFLARAEGWFTRASASLLGQLPCRRGCSRCCIGPFAITTLDAAELQRGLVALNRSVRQEIEGRARVQARRVESEFPRLKQSPYLDDWSDPDIDALVERFADLPCPALHSDGSCLVYPFRPATCRAMGIPVETDGLVEGACPVQSFIPIVRLTRSLREEEQVLAAQEAVAIDSLRQMSHQDKEEVLLTYGFLSDSATRSSEPRQGSERCVKVSASLLEADAPVAQRIEH
ncbi:MAG: hypothetical protein FJ249_09095 [Nitrospira sp.]|nr:hypothetical protein [Nitrospira sp.]